MDEDPLAYFLTWTTYGTWLHGDRRGSVDDSHNLPGHPFVPPDTMRRIDATARMAETPFSLDLASKRAVRGAVEDHARLRDWRLYALNVRSNHVHVVISAQACPPERIVAQLKSWATRRLREAGCLEGRRRVWTKMASTRWIWDQEGLEAVVRYTLEGQ